MTAGSVAAFWATAALLIAVPGADWAFVLGAALRDRLVLPAVAGLALGYAGITALVAAGVGALVAGSPDMIGGLTLAGGIYLVWLGATTLARPAGPPLASGGAAGGGWAVLRKGVGVSGLNPKGLLILVALLPQFTDGGGAWPVAAQIALLGLVFSLSCAAFYLEIGRASCRESVEGALGGGWAERTG